MTIHDATWLLQILEGAADQSQAAGRLYTVLTDIVCFSLNSKPLRRLQQISGGYQEDILEQSENSKMAAKIAADV